MVNFRRKKTLTLLLRFRFFSEENKWCRLAESNYWSQVSYLAYINALVIEYYHDNNLLKYDSIPIVFCKSHCVNCLGPPGSSWEGVSWRFWFWLWVFVLYGGFCNNWIIDIVLVANLQFSLCSEIILRTVHVANSDLCVRCIYKSVFVPYGACYNMWYLLSLCWNKSQH